MAAQPPQHVPDEAKPILKSRGFWLTVIGVVLATGFGLIVQQATTGASRPNSDRAVIVLEGEPDESNDYRLQVVGNGWDGDTAVKVLVRVADESAPGESMIYGELVTKDGRFVYKTNLDPGSVSEYESPEGTIDYQVIVEGQTTKTKKLKEFWVWAPEEPEPI